jgi:hypothetical protein
MNEFTQAIENYGQDVNELDTSPFESICMFHDHRELQKVFD